MCCEYLATMPHVEIFFHCTTIILNIFHGSTLSKAITCSSHFAYMRVRTSPCSQLGCFGFLIWISNDASKLEEVAFFLPLLYFFHEPSSLLLCPFAFNWKHVANKKMMFMKSSDHFWICCIILETTCWLEVYVDQDLVIVFKILQLDIKNMLLKQKDDPWNLVISFVDVALNWKHVHDDKTMTFMIWFL